MIETIDQLSRVIHLESKPTRIVSLVPSITELLADLGLVSNIEGCTKFCVYPKGLRKRTTVIGGTKNINIQKIRNINPDLIICNKEENVKSQVDQLSSEFNTWISDISTGEEAEEMIMTMGHIFQKEYEAKEIIRKNNLAISDRSKRRLKAVYLIWKGPFMTVGRDTYIHDMIVRCGFQNVFGDKERYPETDISEIIERQPDLLFLSSEPYPFKEEHVEELKKLVPESTAVLVDGAFFSWYGSRAGNLPDYLAHLNQQLAHICDLV